MSKKYIATVEQLSIGETASGNHPFVKTSAGNVQVVLPGGAVQSIATTESVAAAIGGSYEKVQFFTGANTMIPATDGKTRIFHLEGGTLNALSTATWPIPTSPQRFEIQNHTGAITTFSVTTGGGQFAGMVDFDGDAVENANFIIPINSMIAVTVDEDGWVQVAPAMAGYSKSEVDTALAGKSATTHTHSDATTSVSGLMSGTDKTKLNGVASGAEVNVNPDWNAVSGDAQILNKPTIPAATVINNTLTSTSTTEALSAAQGKVLQDAKQATLVSGTNIKTVNGTTLLGIGDVPATVTVTNTDTPTLTGATALTVSTALVVGDWGKQIPVDASAGNVNIILPTAVGYSGQSIRVIRLDSSANTVTVFAFDWQGIGGIQASAAAVGLKGVGSATFKSDGTKANLAAWASPASVSRLWLPTDHANLHAWYKPESLGAVGGVAVGTWADSGGAARNLTGTAGAKVSTTGVNGYRAMATDAGSDRVDHATFGTAGDPSITIAGVADWVTGGGCIGVRGAGATNTQVGVIQTSATNLRSYLYANTTTDNPNDLVTGWNILLGSRDASTATKVHLAQNNGNTPVTANGTQVASVNDTFRIGAQDPAAGGGAGNKYAEVAVFLTALGATDRDLVNGYLAHKFALQANLSGAHNYKIAPPVIALATY